MSKYEVIEIPANTANEGERPRRQLRVAAYCRVSTSLEAQQNSFQAQQEYYTDKIASNPDWTLAAIFSDEGITGTSAKKRPGFQKMISWCDKGKIDLIITKSITRFARNTEDCLHYVRYLQRLNIPVIFESEGIDTSKNDNELLLTILGATSQAESEATSSRVKWGVREAFRKGKVRYYYKDWLGYQKGVSGTPEIIPEEAAVVKQIYDMYLHGYSLRNIKDTLEGQGAVRKDGSTVWTLPSILGILRNEKYTGDALLQKTYISDPITKQKKINTGELPQYLVKNCHPAIISHETFDMVQAEMARREKPRGIKQSGKTDTKQKTYSGKYALSEILVCAECNTLYRRCTWKRDGKTRIVWRCRNRLDHGKKYCKHSPTIDEPVLHRALVDVINRQLYRPEYLLAPFDRTLNERASDEPVTPASSMSELYANLLEMERRLDIEFVDLLTEYAANENWDGDADPFQELLYKRRELEQAIHILELEQYENEHQQRKYPFPYKLTEYHDTIARLVFDRIQVFEDGHLLIRFKSGEEVEQKLDF